MPFFYESLHDSHARYRFLGYVREFGIDLLDAFELPSHQLFRRKYEEP